MLETIQNRPESFPTAYRQARRARLRRFPYAIYFQMRDECISVIAILHASRDHNRLLPDRG
jgi:plasmid stabilization system protein ParE